MTSRGKLFEVSLVERSPQSYSEPKEALAWLRQQLWTASGSPKDQTLERLALERLEQRNGRYALNWTPVAVGIVTWAP